MLRFVYSILLCLLAAAGCSGHFLPVDDKPAAVETNNFVMVKAGPGDSLVSLARTYLHNGDKAWRIAAFNDIETVTPGQQVVIPLKPMLPGGIQPNGYQTVPVLLYPGLTARRSKSKAVYAQDFERQMHYLDENGFTTVSLDLFYAYLSHGDELPPMAVIVTFDTTRSWAYEIAYPVLKANGMKAAFFIRPDDVGAKGRLTWTQLSEMAAGGMDIGLHGSRIKPPAKEDVKTFFEAFEKTFSAPKLALRTQLKRSCRYFAFAGGTSSDLVIAMLKKHGYRIGFTRKRGVNPFYADNFKIKRSTIHGHYTMEQFLKNLSTFQSAELK